MNQESEKQKQERLKAFEELEKRKNKYIEFWLDKQPTNNNYVQFFIQENIELDYLKFCNIHHKNVSRRVYFWANIGSIHGWKSEDCVLEYV